MDVSEPGPDDLHAGYTPEEGVLSRVREWTDVFGWLRLVRVLRLAGSPTALAIVALTLAVWMLGSSLFGWRTMVHGTIDFADAGGLNSVLGSYLIATPSSLLDRASYADGFWTILMLVVWSVLLWTPVALFLMRQGALLTAGRNLDDAKSVMRLAILRTPGGWLIAIMPLACGLAIGLLIMALGFVSRISMGMQWMEFVFAVAVTIVAVLGGILLFGAKFAVPLGFVALINEPQPDAIDSLSRGYEYVYRRPLRLAMYIAISVVPLWVVAWLSAGISTSAINLSNTMLTAAGASEELMSINSAMLGLFPIIVAITLVGGLIGGVYLLLRSDAGGQEVEDIWMPKPQPKQLLPSLPVDDDV